MTRVRLFPAKGGAAALKGGKIRGSNAGATTGFVDLYSISTAPPEGAWLDISFANETGYRYVEYQSPPGSFGALAELELDAGATRLSGKAFGTAGSKAGTGNTFNNAVDGNTATYFEGALSDGNYVGLDLGADHVAGAPRFSLASGTYAQSQTLSLASSTEGATIRYTVDGRDPKASGVPYAGPIAIDRTVTVKAIATKSCMLDSDAAEASYFVASDAAVAVTSSLHIGNSLTDTIVDHLDVMAAAGGIQLDFHRYTIPGAGIPWIWDHPQGGFGEVDVRETLQTRGFDHLTLQPFPNEPCMASGPGSDAELVGRFYDLALAQNPNVQLWIYQQWPEPTNLQDCLSNGATWVDRPWAPPVPNPATWDDAVGNQLAYQEQVRASVMAAHPGAKPVYVIPGGLALRALKTEVSVGTVPQMSDFFSEVFDDGGTNLHLTEAGRYLISAVFYACMFQRNPAELVGADPLISPDEARRLGEIAWSTVTAYPLSGVRR